MDTVSSLGLSSIILSTGIDFESHCSPVCIRLMEYKPSYCMCLSVTLITIVTITIAGFLALWIPFTNMEQRLGKVEVMARKYLNNRSDEGEIEKQVN